MHICLARQLQPFAKAAYDSVQLGWFVWCCCVLGLGAVAAQAHSHIDLTWTGMYELLQIWTTFAVPAITKNSLANGQAGLFVGSLANGQAGLFAGSLASITKMAILFIAKVFTCTTQPAAA